MRKKTHWFRRQMFSVYLFPSKFLKDSFIFTRVYGNTICRLGLKDVNFASRGQCFDLKPYSLRPTPLSNIIFYTLVITVLQDFQHCTVVAFLFPPFPYTWSSYFLFSCYLSFLSFFFQIFLFLFLFYPGMGCGECWFLYTPGLHFVAIWIAALGPICLLYVRSS